MAINIEEIQDRTLQIYQEVDKIVNKFPSCCKRGCSFCCHQNIRIVSSEEIAIIKYLDSNVYPDVKQKIKCQLIDWLNYFNQTTPNKLLDENDIGVFEDKIARDRIPCFFLISGECSIYPVRPIVCRTHIVESNPERCDSDRRRNGNPIAKVLRDSKTLELLKTSPINGIRLLAYAVKDYFGVKMNVKPVQIRLLKPKG